MKEVKDQPTTVDEYIAQFPQEVQQVLVKIRAVIRETAPQAEERISYHMPGYYLNGNLIFFAVNKRHIGIYPTTPEMEAGIEGLSAYKGAKSSVHFPLDKPVPYELLRQMVAFRIAENLKK